MNCNDSNESELAARILKAGLHCCHIDLRCAVEFVLRCARAPLSAEQVLAQVDLFGIKLYSDRDDLTRMLTGEENFSYEDDRVWIRELNEENGCVCVAANENVVGDSRYLGNEVYFIFEGAGLEQRIADASKSAGAPYKIVSLVQHPHWHEIFLELSTCLTFRNNIKCRMPTVIDGIWGQVVECRNNLIEKLLAEIMRRFNDVR